MPGSVGPVERMEAVLYCGVLRRLFNFWTCLSFVTDVKSICTSQSRSIYRSVELNRRSTARGHTDVNPAYSLDGGEHHETCHGSTAMLSSVRGSAPLYSPQINIGGTQGRGCASPERAQKIGRGCFDGPRWTI